MVNQLLGEYREYGNPDAGIEDERSDSLPRFRRLAHRRLPNPNPHHSRLFGKGHRDGSLRPGYSLLNDWHHILYQWDGSGVVEGMRVWVDGTYVTNRSSDVNNPFLETIQNDVPFRIGVRDPSSSGMNGRIDDVRVFARELNAAERAVLAFERAPEIKRPVPSSVLQMPMMGA